MPPYYDEAGITIYHGDSRDLMPELADVGLVVTDPPYVFGIQSTEGKTGWGDVMNAAVWYVDWLKQVKRLTANQSGAAWVFNSWRCYPILARASFEVWPIESLLVWDKDWIGPGGARGLRRQHEFVALFAHPTFSIPNRSLPDVWRCKWMNTIGDTDHRAEKPVELVERMIDCSSPSGTVLDPFLGSGTTLVAAKRLGRRAIGIEIEEQYCEMAAKRLAQSVLEFADHEAVPSAAGV